MSHRFHTPDLPAAVALPAATPAAPLASAPAQPMIQIRNLSKMYSMGETQVHALREVSLTIGAGEYVAIVGASGSGKSTLMNIIGLLDFPTSGSYHIRGTEAAGLSKRHQADLRNREIGFVFQRFNLLARTTAQRQVELPLFYAGVASSQARIAAHEALHRVGLGDRTHHRPDELSGGQQQRVAIARALVNQPALILADEPTGALDSRTGQEILALFDELNRQGITLVVVTHDHGVAAHALRTITLSDGQIVDDHLNEPSGRVRPATNGLHAMPIAPQSSLPESQLPPSPLQPLPEREVQHEVA
ncbi:MAG: ABC transporter ATP-binding protein [Caldilineaceae bacterium]